MNSSRKRLMTAANFSGHIIRRQKKQGQKTHFKRDKLFINGKEIGPPTDRHMETDKRQQQETEGARQKEPPRRGPQQNNDRPRGAPRSRRGKHS
ncbi:Hypothetical predicted protein [Mytilus galloprovincialis]|uniref:Uncharacterized protein n=1 Tax=Mytilus galloprovincialis TaxID=29158 RepID=A0A8B6D7W4_MYTGA|nr:Hypothetical predicted protein [Mytilus galloprovincialis]